jgi:hypothetical protein
MAHLNLQDLASRSRLMAKHFIKDAIKHPGAFRKKAEAAGETTREFAKEHEHDSGKTGQQARLAETLMGMHHGDKKKSRREALYDHPRSRSR